MTRSKLGFELAFSAAGVVVLWLAKHNPDWWVYLLVILVPASIYWLGQFGLNLLRIPVERQGALEVEVSNQQTRMAQE